MKSSTFSQIIKGGTILILVLSFLLSPKVLVSAQTSAEEAQNLPLHSYSPIILGGEGTYYVSPEGDDTNPGTILLPWRTIGKASNIIEAGDTVYIRGGVYQEAAYFTKSGTSNAQINILAYPGETPVIDGNNFSIPSHDWWPLLSLYGDYIKVSGLEVRYSRGMGVALVGMHDIAEKIYSHHNKEDGIVIIGDYGTVLNSRIWQNALSNENGMGVMWSGGLSACRDQVDGTTDFAVMSGNVVWENWGEGISTHEANGTIIQDNIVYDNWNSNVYIHDASNILLQRNFVYDTGAMISDRQIGISLGEEYDIQSENITIINNIVYGTNRNFYWWEGLHGRGMSNVLISNNTFVNSIGYSGLIIEQDSYQNVRFTNNLTQQDGPLSIILVESNPELHLSNNLWSKTPPTSAQGPSDIIGDPILAHTGDQYSPEWFKLTDISPAIDNAEFQPILPFDYFRELRGCYPDIGADENNPVIQTQKLYLPLLYNRVH